MISHDPTASFGFLWRMCQSTVLANADWYRLNVELVLRRVYLISGVKIKGVWNWLE
jgi:hypothetical protein